MPFENLVIMTLPTTSMLSTSAAWVFDYGHHLSAFLYITLSLIHTAAASYHDVNRWQSFQHTIRSQQRRAKGILDHRGALHPHLGQLLCAQWLEPSGKLPGELQP